MSEDDQARKLRESVNIAKTTANNPAAIPDSCGNCGLTIPESGIPWRIDKVLGVFRKVHKNCPEEVPSE
jgi:hypothetical protein